MNKLTMEEQNDLANKLRAAIDSYLITPSPDKYYTYEYDASLSFEIWINYVANTLTVDTVTIIGRICNVDWDAVTFPWTYKEADKMSDLQYLVRMCVEDAD